MTISKHHNHIHLGILSAMPEETGQILENLENVSVEKYGDLEIFTGKLKLSKDKHILISTCFSGWGKVSSARAATRLISKTYFKKQIDFILFSGVAGSANSQIKQWDIVISESVIQYDLDCRPIFDQFTIPALKKKEIFSNKYICNNSLVKINQYLESNEDLPFKTAYKGIIGTGDKFISDSKYIDKIKVKIPSLLAVEMEGCAVAQVAEQENVPWLIMRIISDSANESAAQNFSNFLEIYKRYSWEITREIIIYISSLIGENIK